MTNLRGQNLLSNSILPRRDPNRWTDRYTECGLSEPSASRTIQPIVDRSRGSTTVSMSGDFADEVSSTNLCGWKGAWSVGLTCPNTITRVNLTRATATAFLSSVTHHRSLSDQITIKNTTHARPELVSGFFCCLSF